MIFDKAALNDYWGTLESTFAFCLDVLDKAVISWEGMVDENNIPTECNKGNKELLLEFYPELMSQVVDKILKFDWNGMKYNTARIAVYTIPRVSIPRVSNVLETQNYVVFTIVRVVVVKDSRLKSITKLDPNIGAFRMEPNIDDEIVPVKKQYVVIDGLRDIEL